MWLVVAQLPNLLRTLCRAGPLCFRGSQELFPVCIALSKVTVCLMLVCHWVVNIPLSVSQCICLKEILVGDAIWVSKTLSKSFRRP